MITLSGRLYAVVRTEDGQRRVITRKPEWRPEMWRPAPAGLVARVLAGLTLKPILVAS